MPGEPGYWAVLKHADVVHVAPRTGAVLGERRAVSSSRISSPTQLAMMRNMLLAMDPPRHTDYRKPLADSFKAKVIGRMEEQIRTICREILDRAAEQRDVEFVHDVTVLPPVAGGGRAGRPARRRTGTRSGNGRSATPAARTPSYAADADGNALDGHGHVRHGVRRPPARRAAPGRPGVADPGRQLRRPAHERPRLRQLLRAAGHRRQRHHQDHAVLGPARPARRTPTSWPSCGPTRRWSPGRWRRSCAGSNPLHYFRRTATADTELRGTPIRAGDKVAMYYSSANRDEDVFADSAALRHPPRSQPASVASASPSISASGCTSPGSRDESSSGAARHVPHDRADR